MNDGIDNLYVMTVKLILAGVLGGIIGYERERHEHPAGLRTHILVCFGSTLIMLISQSFGSGYDPGRIAAQIVSGIGFLGAGTIMRQGSVVRGLTTAASLWTVAAIGMAVGAGHTLTIYTTLAILATLIVFIILSSIRYIETFWGKGIIQDIILEIPDGKTEILSQILDELNHLGVQLDSMKNMPIEGSKKMRWRMRIVISKNINQQSVLEVFTSREEQIKFEWE